MTSDRGVRRPPTESELSRRRPRCRSTSLSTDYVVVFCYQCSLLHTTGIFFVFLRLSSASADAVHSTPINANQPTPGQAACNLHRKQTLNSQPPTSDPRSYKILGKHESNRSSQTGRNEGRLISVRVYVCVGVYFGCFAHRYRI